MGFGGGKAQARRGRRECAGGVYSSWGREGQKKRCRKQNGKAEGGGKENSTLSEDSRVPSAGAGTGVQRTEKKSRSLEMSVKLSLKNV